MVKTSGISTLENQKMTGKAHAQRLEIEHHGTHDPGEKCFKKEMTTKPSSSKTSPDQGRVLWFKNFYREGCGGSRGGETHMAGDSDHF